MATVEENTKTKHTFKVLAYRLLIQVSWVFFLGTLATSCWLGYLGWSHIQMTNPPNPENIIWYATGAMYGFTICVVTLIGIMTWQYAVNRADNDRNIVKMFLHFNQKHFSNVVPLAEKCKNQSELMRELQQAGVDSTDINNARGKELDDTMFEMRKSDIDQQFVDLAGHIGTMRRQNDRYNDQIELAKAERAKQRELLDDLRKLKEETDRLAEAASELLIEQNSDVIKLQKPAE